MKLSNDCFCAFYIASSKQGVRKCLLDGDRVIICKGPGYRNRMVYLKSTVSEALVFKKYLF